MEHKVPSIWLDALSFLPCYRNLQILHVFFNDSNWNLSWLDEFRYRILSAIIHNLAGGWKLRRQLELKGPWCEEYLITYFPDDFAKYQTPIPIRRLWVANLNDFNDDRLTSKEAFKTILALPSLIDLNLFVSRSTKEDTQRYAERFPFFNSLPSTWLNPVLAANLRSLTLFCPDEWGWHPKMDFRHVGAGKGMPNLKSLSLGHFVFSHMWQVEWFGSLDLERFHLICCSVLHQAKHPVKMDSGTSVVGKDEDGRKIVVSNDGYFPEETRGTQEESEVVDHPLRWHQLLTHWRQSMCDLSDFKIITAHEEQREDTMIANFSDNYDTSSRLHKIKERIVYKFNHAFEFSYPDPSPLHPVHGGNGANAAPPLRRKPIEIEGEAPKPPSYPCQYVFYRGSSHAQEYIDQDRQLAELEFQREHESTLFRGEGAGSAERWRKPNWTLQDYVDELGADVVWVLEDGLRERDQAALHLLKVAVRERRMRKKI